MAVQKECVVCGKGFCQNQSWHSYCSTKCKQSVRRSRYWSNPLQKHRPVSKTCPRCSVVFKPTNNRHVFCTKQCYGKSRCVGIMLKQCDGCGTTFLADRNIARWCSKRCKSRTSSRQPERRSKSRLWYLENVRWGPQERACDVCGTLFQAVRSNNRFCSTHCREKFVRSTEKCKETERNRRTKKNRHDFEIACVSIATQLEAKCQPLPC
jgi:hypothetical protein